MSQVENLKDSFEVIKSKSKPLAAYLFTNDVQLKKDFVQNISSGGMLINDTILHVIALFLKFTQKRQICPIFKLDIKIVRMAFKGPHLHLEFSSKDCRAC